MNKSSTTMDNLFYQGDILSNEPLASYTTWRVGGIAKCLYKPKNITDLSLFLKHLPPEEPVVWLGLGSNSLIKDTGFMGTVILTQGCLKNIQLIKPGQIRVEAGVSCATLARFCARNELTGGEFWAGIPGTMGGALRMNAGCFNGETWNLVTEVETITRNGIVNIRKPNDFQIAYRQVEGLDNEWFVAATCKLIQGDRNQSLQLIKELLSHRAKTQPINEYNCGSVFRNPPGHYAAKLIESCGLKGVQIGGAMVSQKHANFIINNQGQASAHDIETLITLIYKTVSQQKAIQLVREVHIIGD
jgi:UDP-N-acetylmuramate dehydrogenase